MQSQDSQQIFQQLGKVFRRRKYVILFCILGVLAPIIYYNETALPIYEASTTIVFEEFSTPVPTYDYESSREVFIFNRIEEIKSLSFAEDVVKAMPDEVVKKFRFPEDLPEYVNKRDYVKSVIHKNLDAFPVRNANIVRISVELYDPVLCMVLANTAAEVFQERNFKIKQEGISGVRKFIEEQLDRFSKQLNEAEQALKRFKEENRITSIDRQSEETLRKMTEAEVLYNQVRAARGSKEERLASIRQSLAQQKQNLVPSITEISTPWIQRLKEKLLDLNRQYLDLRIQNYSPDHPKMLQLQKDIEQTKSRLAEEAVKMAKGENIIDPIAQIEKLVNESYALEIEIETLKAQEKALANTIRQYDRALESLPEKEYELTRLTRQRNVTEKIYIGLLEKREEAKISEAEKFANTRIIDRAQIPSAPIKPRKKFNIAIGMVVGLIFGVGLAYLFELKHPFLHSFDELEKLTHWPVLATIPNIELISNGKFKLFGKSGNHMPKSRLVKYGLISNLEPKSGASEAYRMLRTNLQFSGIGKTCKTILATSIGPGDGKSTTLSNLAVTFASLGEKVLLIDADLRRPVLHKVFGVDKEPGLSDLLVTHKSVRDELSSPEEESLLLGNKLKVKLKEKRFDELVDNFSDFVFDDKLLAQNNNIPVINDLNLLHNSLMESVQFTQVENVLLLASGSTIQNPSETISTVAMKALLDHLKETYSIILIDTAPLLLVPDTAILSTMVDGVLFVVDSNTYDQEMMTKGKNLLAKAKANVIGLVLNNVELEKKYQKSYYYYGE